MIQITIKDTDKIPMWFLPGTKIYINFDNPSTEIDETKLTEAQKRTIAVDVQRGVLECSVPIKLEALLQPTESTKAVTPQVPQSSKIQNKPTLETIEETRNQRIEEIKSCLTMKLTDLKKLIKSKSISELRILLDEERADKNRKTIIQTIELAISKHQAQVFNEVAKELGGINPVTTKLTIKDFDGIRDTQYLDNISDVIESEITEVRIKLGADD